MIKIKYFQHQRSVFCLCRFVFSSQNNAWRKDKKKKKTKKKNKKKKTTEK